MKMLPNQTKIVDLILQLWEKYPQLRFGQLLEAYAFGHHVDRDGCIFYCQDSKVIENLEKALNGSN